MTSIEFMYLFIYLFTYYYCYCSSLFILLFSPFQREVFVHVVNARWWAWHQLGHG